MALVGARRSRLVDDTDAGSVRGQGQMTDQQIGATERFAALVATMTAADDVAVGTRGSRGFGTDA